MFKKIIGRFSASSSNSSLSEEESPFRTTSRSNIAGSAGGASSSVGSHNLRRNSRSNPVQLNAQDLASSSHSANALANLFLDDHSYDLYSTITTRNDNKSSSDSSSGGSGDSARSSRRSHSHVNSPPDRNHSFGELVFDLFDHHSNSSQSLNREPKAGSAMKNSASFSAANQHNHDFHYDNETYRFGSSYSSTSSDIHKIDLSIENVDLVHETNNVLFKNRYHSDKTMYTLNEIRKNNIQLCDVILAVEEMEIPCHKAILIANSSYFLGMFSVGLLETSQTRVKLNEMDSNSLRLLIDFMYTGQVLITEVNVQMLLITSNILNLMSVKDSCCQFIQSQIEISNCIGIREFADLHSCPILQKHAEAFIEEYFSEIIKGEEFLSLSEAKIVEMISNEHLALSSELIVFKAILNWIKHDKISRIDQLPKLMKYIRMPLMRPNDLKHIAENEMVKRCLECKSLIEEAQFFQSTGHLPTTSIVISEYALTRIKPRTPLGLPKVLYLFGGQAPKAIDKVDAYDFKTQQWKKCKKLHANRCRAGCVFHKDLIYLIGGFNGQNRERSVDIYNPSTDEWHSGPEMQYRRGTLGVSLLNDKIYAVGGFDGQTGLMTVECYDTITKSWSIIAPLSIRRSSVSTTSLNNYLYAIGGYCGVSRECLDSVERYDPFTDTWTAVAPMHCRRSGACVSIFDSKIYVVGGHDGPSVHKTAEVYNPATNKWEMIAEMNSNRRNSAFVINNGLFYIIGGDDGHVNLSSVEIYNPQRNIWTLLPSFLSEARSYMCGVVVEKLSK